MKNVSYTNPVAPRGADPWVVKDGGDYYYCYSAGTGVCVSRISDPAHTSPEGGVRVYTAPEGTAWSKEYWAPELHKIGGRWYIYVAADDGDNYHHRMYVLGCIGESPLSGFEMLGKISDATDKWAIDGTVLTVGGENYFVWSGWEGDVNVEQNIYIAHMKSPTEIDSERVMLSRPEYEWERRGGSPAINEGPAALYHGDAAHIIYSASGSWCDDYCLGRLTYRGGDVLDPKNWEKSAEPVFEKTETCFGPGHCSFTKDASGDDVIVYHGNLVSGTGWHGRSVWTQKIDWNGDIPVLGKPIGPDVELTMAVD